ncbi:MAG: hypothetical protein U0175_00115 [Caldilineaceae bacterium]
MAISTTPVAAQANEPVTLVGTGNPPAVETVVPATLSSTDGEQEQIADTSTSDDTEAVTDTNKVFALTSAGNEIAAATPTATPMALDIPHVTAPVYGATTSVSSYPPLGLPTFGWDTVAGANYYEVQVSADPGFSLLLPSGKAIETYAATYTLLKSLPDGEYYWRVRACIDHPDTCYEYSETQMFRKMWTNEGAAIPQLISPLQNSTRITFTEDDFSWTPVLGAAKYLFELSSDVGFGTSSIVYSAESLTTRHTPFQYKNALENRTYYWRVTPIDHQGNKGEASDVGHFVLNWNVVPQLLAPIDDAVLQFSPRFQWTAVEGARMYQLEVSTDQNFGTLWGHGFNLPNTSANFRENLPNDQEFYWRVKGTDYWGKSTPWSEVRSFRMKWNFEAQLLAPPNDANSPGTELSHFYLTWTPIPGAEKYQVQVDESDYKKPLLDEMFYNVNSAMLYKVRDTQVWLDKNYTWRVRGVDAQGNVTPWSDEFPFQMSSTEVSPNLVYPPFYFEPDTVNMPQYREFTVSWPLFVWDTAFRCPTSPEFVNCPSIIPKYYELTVSSDITFQTTNFKIQTKNSAAAPTLTDKFLNLQDGHIYYWKVTAVIDDPDNPGHDLDIGQPAVWRTKIDRNSGQVAQSNQIALMHPRNGMEAVGTPPILGWQPVAGAASYKVEIARDSQFQTVVDQETAQFIYYVPWQTKLEEMPFGTYFWRVQAQNAQGQSIGNWSEVRYFHLSKDIITGNPFELWPPPFELPVTTPGSPGVRHTIFETYTKSGLLYDPSRTYMTESEDSGFGDYELGKLRLMLNRVILDEPRQYPPKAGEFDNHEWLIAFEVTETVSAPVEYGIYVDIDHVEGSGATVDPKGYSIPMGNRYLPEYVLYIDRQGGDEMAFDASKVTYFSWDVQHKVWLPGVGHTKTLADIAGRAWYAAPNALENTPAVIQLVVPYEKLGIDDTQATGSLALTMFSIDHDSHTVLDTIPKQGITFDNPLFVSDMLMPLYPFDTPLSNPMVYKDMPPFRWRMPYFDTVDGYQVEIARDPKFTDRVELWELAEKNKEWPWSWLPHDFQSIKPYEDNESLYMRVRMRNERIDRPDNMFDYSRWSWPIRIKLSSRRPGNLTITPDSPAWMTPTFTWDRVDGASGYTLQVDNDANFTSPVIDEKVYVPSFTPLELLPDGTYYWRVLARRSDELLGEPSESFTFTMRLVTPVPIAPVNNVELNDMPTFHWQSVLTPNDIPRQSASRYKIELSNDSGFSKPFIFYSENNTFTPPASVALPSGTWYWRVGVLDWDNNEGSLSPVQTFKLAYPTLTLLGPKQGDQFSLAPEFSWEPVEGAAYYELWLDTDPGFTKPTKVKTDSSRYTPTTKFAGGTYYWQVRMYNSKDVPGAFQQGKFVIISGAVYLPLVVR